MRIVSGWKKTDVHISVLTEQNTSDKASPTVERDQTPELSWRSRALQLSSPKAAQVHTGEAAMSAQLTAWQGGPGMGACL